MRPTRSGRRRAHAPPAPAARAALSTRAEAAPPPTGRAGALRRDLFGGRAALTPPPRARPRQRTAASPRERPRPRSGTRSRRGAPRGSHPREAPRSAESKQHMSGRDGTTTSAARWRRGAGRTASSLGVTDRGGGRLSSSGNSSRGSGFGSACASSFATGDTAPRAAGRCLRTAARCKCRCGGGGGGDSGWSKRCVCCAATSGGSRVVRRSSAPAASREREARCTNNTANTQATSRAARRRSLRRRWSVRGEVLKPSLGLKRASLSAARSAALVGVHKTGSAKCEGGALIFTDLCRCGEEDATVARSISQIRQVSACASAEA